MKRIIILGLLIIGILIINGCAQQKQYVCSDGSVVSDSSFCTNQENEMEKTSIKKVELELIPHIVELNADRSEGSSDKKYVTLKNKGNIEVDYAVLCSPYPNRWNADYYPYNDFAKQIPDPNLKSWVECGHGDKWQDKIGSLETHSLDITYYPWDDDRLGRHETKLVIGIKSFINYVNDYQVYDYKIEIPIIINVQE